MCVSVYGYYIYVSEFVVHRYFFIHVMDKTVFFAENGSLFVRKKQKNVCTYGQNKIIMLLILIRKILSTLDKTYKFIQIVLLKWLKYNVLGIVCVCVNVSFFSVVVVVDMVLPFEKYPLCFYIFISIIYIIYQLTIKAQKTSEEVVNFVKFIAFSFDFKNEFGLIFEDFGHFI